MAGFVLEHLTKSFVGPDGSSVCAVNDFSLAVTDRELVALVGPSGCGKTTLLRLIAGLEKPERGRIQFDGKSAAGPPHHERNVALVFQSSALFPHLTGFENIALGLRLRGVPNQQTQVRVQETAELLGVSHCLERRPGQLSGGERQRIALGRALVGRPEILLLDEPLANLDAPLRAQLRSEIQAIRRRLDLTIVHVTHDQAEALALGDRVAVMRAGRLEQVGPGHEIHAAPANRFVAEFLGSPIMNFFPGLVARREGQLFFTGEDVTPENAPPAFMLRLEGENRAAWACHKGQRVLLGIRPEHLLAVETLTPGDSRPGIRAKVTNVEFTGAEKILRLLSGKTSFHVRAGADVSWKPEQSLVVMFDLRRARVFDAATGGLLF